jgi:hypothetical protein
MKKVMLFLALSVSIALASCGGSASVMGNTNVSQTNVELSKKNFNILGKIRGESTNINILGIGGASNTAILESAKNNMMSNANLSGSKAIINVTYDKHYNGFFPLYSKVTVTASAYIVEFTE